MLDSIKDKIYDLDHLLTQVAQWRMEKKKLVFTNGCFDILHLGHLSYLAETKALGDKLIIGLNSDASVKRLKGDTRPINEELSRAMMLASFSFVDAVTVFETDTPLDLIKAVIPDILVKGGDYKLNQIVGHDVIIEAGGVVKTIPFLEGYSSSNIIARIKGS